MGRAGRWLKGFLGMKKEKHVNDDKVSNNNSEDDFEVASFSLVDNHRKDKKRWSFSSRFVQVPWDTKTRQLCSAKKVVTYSRGGEGEHRGKVGGGCRESYRGGCYGRMGCCGHCAVYGRQRQPEGFFVRRWQGEARKALKTLKGIVKLQSLIRGYMGRKETAAAVQTMQAQPGLEPLPSLHGLDDHSTRRTGLNPVIGREDPSNDETRSSFRSKRYSSWDRIDGEISVASPKIIEIDADKPHVQLSKLNWKDLRDYDPYLPSMAQGSPFFRSFTSYRDLVTPTRSLCGECTAIDKHVFPDHPNYMASTQSFQAKSRSTSAPKQRPITEWSRQRRIALREIMAARNSVTGV